MASHLPEAPSPPPRAPTSKPARRTRHVKAFQNPADAQTVAFPSWLEHLGDLFFLHFGRVLVYPLNPVQRIYWLYLATSLAAAAIAWLLYRRRGDAEAERGFLRFCFPREVWSHPSAWLDVRYFFFHQTLRVWMYAGLAASISTATVGWLAADPGTPLPAASLGDRVVLTLVSMLLLDFVGFAAHLVQHRVPWLWEFHKVHHSPTVMQPLSNYREHPVDNLLYTAVTSLAIGLTTAGAAALLGCRFEIVDVLGINAFLFLFNFAGYNLRHSHIWLAWPGFAGHLLGSPAYHQIHPQRGARAHRQEPGLPLPGMGPALRHPGDAAGTPGAGLRTGRRHRARVRQRAQALLPALPAALPQARVRCGSAR